MKYVKRIIAATAAATMPVSYTHLITKSDPGFVNYSGGDFTIKEDSSVYKENPDLPKIDFENIGLLKDESVGVKK